MPSRLQEKIEKYMGESSTITETTSVSQEDVEKVLKYVMNNEEKKKRRPAPPPPEGGISLSEASRIHGIPHQTISRWIKKGYIDTLLKTGREVYIDEDKFAELAKKYKEDPGQGKNTVIPKNEDN